MQKHFGMLVFVCSLTLPGCGNADREAPLTTLSASLRCDTDDDCATGWACRLQTQGSYCESTETPPTTPAPPACTYDSDCAAGEECEYEHGTTYCKPHHDDDYGHAGEGNDDHPKGDDDAYDPSDAATPDGGVPVCSDDDSYGHSKCEDDHGGSYSDDSSSDDDEDRSGPNPGHH